MSSCVRGYVGFLFIGHCKTVSFVPLTERKAGFFNSHSLNEHNKFSQRGKARLFCCYIVEALTSLLLCDNPHDNQWWQLYKLTFQKGPSSEENVSISWLSDHATEFQDNIPAVITACLAHRLAGFEWRKQSALAKSKFCTALKALYRVVQNSLII